MDAPAAVSDAEFAGLMARIGGWGGDRRVAVAVSGGADSLCLAWLAARWGRATGLVVDHGLRLGSDAEASVASARLAGFGMAARFARLDVQHGPGLAARARAARYAALIGMARAEGLLDILVGHHGRDQAETFLIRREGKSGAAGLASMSVVVEQAEVRIVRPLLEMAPGRLRATLVAAGIGWFEDPANGNVLAARGRIRRTLEREAGGGEDHEGFAASARDHAGVRREEEAAVARVLAERVSIRPEGYALLSPGALPAAALAALLRTIGGAVYPARSPDVGRLAAAPRPATLAGVQLLPAGRLGEGFLVVREAAAMQPPVPAEAGAIWDGRFALAGDAEVPAGTTIGAVGSDAAALRGASDLPSAVLRTMPALRCGGQLIGLATEGHPAFCAGLKFRPPLPLAGAGFFL